MVCIQSLIRCGLDYVGLKKRLDGVSDRKKKAAKPGIR